MKQSQLFTKTRKEAPADEVSKNAILLTRAGFIHKESAGVYSYLPLGLRVLRKIESIIREEMNALGAQEMLLTTLQEKEVWEKTGRWDDENVDNWFKTKLKNDAEMGIANTHEEPLTNLLREHASSYRDFPVAIYQFQTKFRNELRTKSGLMRVREFLMKDLYSFSRTEEEFKDFYEKCAEAYTRIFERVGIGHLTYRTTATGGSFTTGLTDEFQTVTDSGEDTIYITDEDGKKAVNAEVEKSAGLQKKAIEVGNIFPLGTKYSEALGLTFTDENGEKKPVIMGSYGIGLGRLMGTVAEVLSDENGLVWPASIAPFRVHIISLGASDDVKEHAEEVYKTLEQAGVEALFDDRDMRAGEKFADADLIGIPTRVVIGDKSIESKMLEVKDRASGEVSNMTLDNLIHKLAPSA